MRVVSEVKGLLERYIGERMTITVTTRGYMVHSRIFEHVRCD